MNTQATIVKHEVDTMPATKVQHHDVTIGIEMPEGKFASATPNKLDAKVGDTVQFGTCEEKFRVKFEPWLFEGPERQVMDSDKLTFGIEGDFTYLCYVTPKGQTHELAYKEGKGGNGNVGRPGK